MASRMETEHIYQKIDPPTYEAAGPGIPAQQPGEVKTRVLSPEELQALLKNLNTSEKPKIAISE